jgi:hypothetical protein
MPLFIVLNQESKLLCISVLVVSISSVSTIS